MERILGLNLMFQVMLSFSCVPALSTALLFNTTLDPKNQDTAIVLGWFSSTSNQK